MHVGPVDAGAEGNGRARLPRTRRLRLPREFSAVLAADRGNSMRGSGVWLSMTAAWEPATSSLARVGVTVGKRMARRAVDRALVKRLVREAFRVSAGAIEHAAATMPARVDISVRLKRSVGVPGDPQRPALGVLRRALRSEADQLFASVAARLASLAAHA